MSENICPFIGVEEDRYTAVGFPSPRNMCHRNETPAPVDTIYQGKYCMTAEHSTCPIFLGQANVPVPPPVAVKAQAQPKATKKPYAVPPKTPAVPVVVPKRRAKDILLPLMAVLGIVAIFVAVLLILPSSGAFQGAPLASPTGSSQPLATLTNTPADLVSLLQGSLTPTLRFSPTPPVTSTAQPTRTATKRSPTPTAISTRVSNLPAPTQCGRPAGWVQYSVRPGDTLSNLSRIFNISIAQLQIANCMGNSVTLYAGQVIYTPWIPATQIVPTQVIPTQVTPTTETPTTAPTTETPIPTTAVPSDTPIPPTDIVAPTEPSPVPSVGAPTLPSQEPPPPSGDGD